MGSHWPLVIAAGVIALAAGMAVYQHDRSAAAATASAPAVVQPATNKPVAPGTLTPEKAPPPAAAVRPPVTPAAPLTTPVAPPAVERAPVTPTPVAPAVAPKPDLGTQRPFKPAPVAPVAPAAPATPAAVAPEMPRPVAPAKNDPQARVLQDLRALLQTKLAVVPRDLGVAGAFAISMEGVRVEVQPWPQWSVNIYNFNRNAPEQETENFKQCLDLIATAMNIDMTKAAVKTETGKSYMKTTCSLGSISLVRDPATNNSCMIRPIQANALVPPPPRPKNAEQVILPAPKTQSPPVAPPRPPPKDEVF